MTDMPNREIPARIMTTISPTPSTGLGPLPRRRQVLVPFDSCPTCDGDRFAAETVMDRLVFRCSACGAGWMYELGYVRRAT
jgi:hypothetical protein